MKRRENYYRYWTGVRSVEAKLQCTTAQMRIRGNSPLIQTIQYSTVLYSVPPSPSSYCRCVSLDHQEIHLVLTLFSIQKTSRQKKRHPQTVGHIKSKKNRNNNNNNNAIQNIATHRKTKQTRSSKQNVQKHKQTKRRWVQQIHLPLQVWTRHYDYLRCHFHTYKLVQLQVKLLLLLPREYKKNYIYDNV